MDFGFRVKVIWCGKLVILGFRVQGLGPRNSLAGCTPKGEYGKRNDYDVEVGNLVWKIGNLVWKIDDEIILVSK